MPVIIVCQVQPFACCCDDWKCPKSPTALDTAMWPFHTFGSCYFLPLIIAYSLVKFSPQVEFRQQLGDHAVDRSNFAYFASLLNLSLIVVENGVGYSLRVLYYAR